MYKIACLGDSITWTLEDRSTHPYPHRLEQLLGKGYAVGNVAESGYTISQINTIWQQRIRDSAIDSTNTDYHLVVLMGGVNDIRVGTSAATAFATWQTLANNIISKGTLNFIGCTITPFKNYTGAWTSAKETELLSYNASITAWGVNNNKRIIDINALLRDPGDSTQLLPAYNAGDDLHPNETGTYVIAQAVHDAIIALGLGV